MILNLFSVDSHATGIQVYTPENYNRLLLKTLSEELPDFMQGAISGITYYVYTYVGGTFCFTLTLCILHVASNEAIIIVMNLGFERWVQTTQALATII